MIITFKIENYIDDYGYASRQRHVVLVDDVERIKQHDWIEPEDVEFYRDLTSPHDCEHIIREAIEAVQHGHDVIFEHITVDIEEG